MQWYPPGFATRLLTKCPLLIVMTRWHHADLAGWLIDLMNKSSKAEQWEIIKFKAILDEQGARLLGDGAKAGESVFPELWPTESFIQLREMMPPYVWTALYDQEPSQEEGNVILAKWWREWKRKDGDPKYVYVISVWDTAYGTKERNDPSACTVWGVFRDETRPVISKDVFLHNQERQKGPYSLMLLRRFNERVKFPDLRERAVEIHKKHKVDMNFVEPKASGKPLVQELRRRGLPFREWNPERGIRGQESGKYARAHSASVVPHAGSVYYMEAEKGGGMPDWVREVIDQCAQFPNAEHDDLLDTCWRSDTPVMTPLGWKKIVDIEVGEKVLTHKGRFPPRYTQGVANIGSCLPAQGQEPGRNSYHWRAPGLGHARRGFPKEGPGSTRS